LNLGAACFCTEWRALANFRRLLLRASSQARSPASHCQPDSESWAGGPTGLGKNLNVALAALHSLVGPPSQAPSLPFTEAAAPGGPGACPGPAGCQPEAAECRGRQWPGAPRPAGPAGGQFQVSETHVSDSMNSVAARASGQLSCQ
jgi:hypothetical protein